MAAELDAWAAQRDWEGLVSQLLTVQTEAAIVNDPHWTTKTQRPLLDGIHARANFLCLGRVTHASCPVKSGYFTCDDPLHSP